MWTIYVDADACPVKEEIYKVARRYDWRVVVVTRYSMRVPQESLVELMVRAGFAEVDDWIAENAGKGDIVITADIPLADRTLASDARVLDFKGRPFTQKDIGSAMALRDVMKGLRSAGEVTGGPAPMTPKDRSRFLSKLDETINAARRDFPRPAAPTTD